MVLMRSLSNVRLIRAILLILRCSPRDMATRLIPRILNIPYCDYLEILLLVMLCIGSDLLHRVQIRPFNATVEGKTHHDHIQQLLPQLERRVEMACSPAVLLEYSE